MHVKSLVFVQDNRKLRAVLVSQVFVDDKGYRINFSFNVVVFAFIDAQPEHKLRLSARAHLCFAYTHNGLLVVLSARNLAAISLSMLMFMCPFSVCCGAEPG